jgi:hypothetical protein
MPRSTARTHKAGIAVRIVALMALLGAFAASFAAPAGALGSVTVNPNPVSFTTTQTEATATVNWTGQKPNKLMFISICKKSVSDPTFTAALDCSALSELNPNGTPSGAGTAQLTVFRGENPDGDSGWGCFAQGDTAPQGVTTFTTCFVRVTNDSINNKDDATETAFTLSVGGDVVPEAPLGVLIPVIGAVMVAGAFMVLRRRSSLAS